jgi:protein-tyrosine-phosphatase
MAEAFLRHASAAWLQVYSAGTIPTHIHPLAIQTMLARGVDLRGQRSKSVDEFHGQTFDYVITVCDRAREQCPTFAEATTISHWSLPDPALVKGGTTGTEAQIAAFEQIATTLEIRIRYLLAAIQAKHLS